MSLMGGRRSRGFGGAKLRWPAGAGRSKLAARAGSWPELGALSGRIWRELRKGATAGRRGGGDFGAFGDTSPKWRRGRQDTGAVCRGADFKTVKWVAAKLRAAVGGRGGRIGEGALSKTTTAVRLLMGFLEVFWGWNTNNGGERHLVH